MFAHPFRRLMLLCLCLLGGTAVFVIVTAVTAQPAPLPVTPEERALLPHLPTGDKVEETGNGILSPDVPSYVPSWSKGVFQSYRDDNWEIYRSNNSGPNPVIRLTDHAASDIHPRLNRGATRVVFSSNRDGDYELFVMNADGSGLQQLTYNDTSDVNPIWSPDGSRIAFQAYRDGQAEIYVMNANGSNQTRLTADGNYDGDPTWSPDGSKIAFRSARTGTPFIYVMNSNGSGVAQLSAQPSYYVSWSPDGSQIAYTADLDGDNFFELWLMNANGSNQHMIYDPYEQQADAWVRGWTPDGREITFTHIKFIQYQGNWYWEWAYISSYDLPNSWPATLDSTGLDWHPDWQTTDAAPPQTEMEAMPAYSQIPDFHMYWSGADQDTGAGLATYDVQYRIGASGPWVDWQMGVTTTSASYTAVPNTTVTFRARARDHAFNWEPWPTSDNPTTTFYTWQLWGKLTDNRGTPLVNAPLSVAPTPLNAAQTDTTGNFLTRLKTEGSHTLDVNRSGYGDLAQTSLNLENLAHDYLPPGNNALLNGGFEAAQPLANWTTTGMVTAVTTPRHTGTKSTLMGNTNCPYPCLTAGEGMSFELFTPNMTADSEGTLHVVDNGEYGEIIYTNRLTTGTWSAPKILSSDGVNPPRLAIDRNDDLHVLWANNQQIYYSHKPSSGSWSMPTVVSIFPIEYSVINVVTDSQGGLHAFIERGIGTGQSGSFYLYRQPDGTWQTPVLLASSEYGITYRNGLMAIGPDDTLHFIWAQRYSTSPSTFELVYRQRLSDGTWTGKIVLPMPVVGDFHEVITESMAVTSDGNLHVIWSADILESYRHTFHLIRTPSGVWSGPTVIAQEGDFTVEDVQISVDSQGNVHAVFLTTNNYLHNYNYRLWRAGSGWQSQVLLGDQAWYSLTPGTVVDPNDIVHLLVPDQSANGTYFRSLPATSNSTASLSQEVTIPANMPAPTLAFMAQRPGDVPDDGSGLELLVSDGVTTTAVPFTPSGAAWSHAWADMSPWAGQTVTVTFKLTQASGDPRVRLALDDVTLGSAYPDTWVAGHSQGVALPGEQVVYQVEYGNQGGVLAEAGVLTAVLPDTLTFVSASIMPTITNNTLTWNVGDLAATSAPVTLVITTTVSPAAPLMQTIALPISLSAATAEIEGQNNEVTLPLFIGHQVYLPVVFKP